MTTSRVWGPDTALLGFEATVLPLGTADDGELVATLVRGMCDAPSRRAVLYVHGYLDYFFQSHVADAFNENGWDFYALDLRRYGRSLRAGHRPNYITDIAEYDEEIRTAIGIVREEEGHDTVVMLGHSTGGLIASLYAHRATGAASGVDALILNSPFLEFAVPFPRSLSIPVAGALGAVVPWMSDSKGFLPSYGQSLLAEHHGEWKYNTQWKPVRGFPIYFGWVRAIRKAHAVVHRGLRVECPVLLLHSSGSVKSTGAWDDAFLENDIVLDVVHMKRYGPRLGRDVTLHEVSHGMHDLFLSRPDVRAHAIDATLSWLDARFPAGVTSHA